MIKGEQMKKENTLNKIDEIQKYLQEEQTNDNNALMKLANEVDKKQANQQDYLDFRREVLGKRKLIKTILAKIIS